MRKTGFFTSILALTLLAALLAACGLISLTKMIDRLKEDHLRARRLAEAIYDLPGITLNPVEVETNIIVFYFNHPKITIPELLNKLKEKAYWLWVFLAVFVWSPTRM